MRLILSLALLAFCSVTAFAQTSADPQLEWKEVKWAFPVPGMEAVEVNGVKTYKLGEETLGVEDSYNGRPIRHILLPRKIIAAAELVHLQDPKGMPNVNQFLAALAVSLAVVTPEGYNNETIGKGELEGQTIYLFKTKSGANVGAVVSQNRGVVLVMPAPSVK